MIILLIILNIVVISIAIHGYNKSDWDKEDTYMYLGVGSTISLFIMILTLIILIFSYPYNIDTKLAMYEEENTEIEERIKATVQSYKEYEQETFNKIVEKADLQTLILKFPELNSNELVRAEIETFKENNTKIKNLKEAQIDKDIIGWWLFFNIGG